MEFKKLKSDGLAIMADLVSREATDRDAALGAALRRIEIVRDGRYGEGRPDVRLTIALAAGLEAAVDSRWHDRDGSLSMLVEDVEELVRSAERIFDDRQSTIEMIREVRTALSREVSKARRRGLPYRTLDISPTPSEAGSHDLPAVRIGIEALGPLLAAERIAFDAENADDVVRTFAGMRDEQEKRFAVRDQLTRVGADIMIDAVTLAALEDAGVAPAAVIADLQASRIRIIDVQVSHGQLVLYVREGVVTGNVPLGDEMRWQEGRLTVPKTRGLSLARAQGRQLNRLVAHDYFGDEFKVTHASEIGKDVWLRVWSRPVALRLYEASKAA